MEMRDTHRAALARPTCALIASRLWGCGYLWSNLPDMHARPSYIHFCSGNDDDFRLSQVPRQDRLSNSKTISERYICLTTSTYIR